MTVALVEIDRLTRAFGALRALDGVSLEIEEGSWVAITGPSGSGKTTLLNVLAGLDRATSGAVTVGGVELGALSPRRLAEYRRQTVGLVFQQFHLLPYLDAVENVMLAQYLHSMADRAEAEDALRRVGLGSRLTHLPRELSGGEQQRVAIARALINQPRLVLADEPTGNLDGVNEAVVMSLFDELHRAGHTIVLVTHDPAIASRADREIRLEHGRLAEAEAGPAASADLLIELWHELEEAGGAVSIERRGVADLLADGRLRFDGGRLHFTDAGRAQAAEAVRRQRLAEALLERTLERGAEAACGEGLPVAASIAEQVCGFLDHPERCPHGRAIPRGADCPPASSAGGA
jgi:putative ABC transport system ATP-binding protein